MADGDLVTLTSAFPLWDSVSFGTTAYPPDRYGVAGALVTVPREVGTQLIHNGGFFMADQKLIIPDDHVVVRHFCDPKASCTGTPDGNGGFVVAAAVAKQLQSHGFYQVGPDGDLIGAPPGAGVRSVPLSPLLRYDASTDDIRRQIADKDDEITSLKAKLAEKAPAPKKA